MNLKRQTDIVARIEFITEKESVVLNSHSLL